MRTNRRSRERWTRVILGGGGILAMLASGCSVGGADDEEVGTSAQAACTGVKLAASPTGIQDPGVTIALTASNASCAAGETVEYRFAYQREGSGTPYQQIQGWGSSPTVSWNTTGLPGGKYSLIVYARAAGSGSPFQSAGYATVMLNSVCTTATLAASPTPPQPAGTQVDLTSTATCSGGGTPEFRFLYKLSTAPAFSEIKSWGTGTATWNTNGLASGSYQLLVYVRAAGNSSVWEGYRYFNYQIGGGCNSVTLTADPASPKPVGTSVDLTANATCSSGLTPQYRFYVANSSGAWTLLQDWGAATATWDTGSFAAGLHTLRVDARATQTAGSVESQAYQPYDLRAIGFTQIASGVGFHTCAVVNDSTARCWGYNADGELGDGTTADSASPVTVAGLSGVDKIAAGGFHSCAKLSDGTVKCWGGNSDGQLGNGTTVPSATPVAVSGITNAVAVSSGTYHSCALLADGTVACWGDDAFGQVGRSTTYGPDVTTPTIVSGVTGAIAITAGGWHTCALTSAGSVMCWGLNDQGQIGIGSIEERHPTAMAISSLTNVRSISAGDSHTCATRTSGDTYCWGLNDYGQLGNGSTTNSNIPAKVQGIGTALEVSCGWVHSCVRLADKRVRCWGHNEYGELGNGTFTSSTASTAVSDISTATSIAAGGLSGCALLADDTVRCWGDNFYGQLGIGSMTPDMSSTPLAVLAP